MGGVRAALQVRRHDVAWEYGRARKRILEFDANAPQVRVEEYEKEYRPRIVEARARLVKAGAAAADTAPLYDLPDGEAVLVETVQIYVRAESYDEVRLEGDVETPRSHARALSFLHLLYGAGDRVVGKVGAQRVDFHGARMHAVVIEPSGEAGRRERITTGLALAQEMIELARQAGQQIAQDQNFPLRFRVGIDIGPCVAINSGRSDDREPMFIGPAANHAAQLAEGNAEGIYLSDRVRQAFDLSRRTLNEEFSIAASATELGVVEAAGGGRGIEIAAAARLDEWVKDMREHRATTLDPGAFQFHYHTPPLADIDYADLSPSRSIRMPLASIFADLDGYTKFIDRCMATGCLPDAVRLLHILRSEFNAVFQRDFGGRKVRFIGDCIHGVIAAGNSREVDRAETVALATRCAGGLRSSFLVCQDTIAKANEVGLAIGYELGETPVSRIGIRGDRSVRVASSLATKGSELCQRDCNHVQTKIGERAFAAATANIRKLFDGDRKADNLTFEDVATAAGSEPKATAVAPSIFAQPARVREPEPARAHAN